MVQNPALLLLDLDVVAHVLKMQDRRLLLDDRGVRGLMVADRLGLLGNGRLLRLRVFCVFLRYAFEGRRDLATGEHEDLTLGLFRRDPLGGDKVGTQEDDNEGYEDAKVSAGRRRNDRFVSGARTSDSTTSKHSPPSVRAVDLV
jgi:hypothetical protein